MGRVTLSYNESSPVLPRGLDMRYRLENRRVTTYVYIHIYMYILGILCASVQIATTYIGITEASPVAL